ncbi:MAG: hypothetical protein ACI9SG_002343, partial [Maribacter sp.]
MLRNDNYICEYERTYSQESQQKLAFVSFCL